MALRDKIIERATPFLEEGERVEAAFAAQTFNPYWAVLSYWIVLFGNAYRSVVVTDRRIIVFDTGKWSSTKAKSIRSVIDRGTVIGPASGLWWKCETLGEKLYVHKRFHKDVAAADAGGAGSDPTAAPA